MTGRSDAPTVRSCVLQVLTTPRSDTRFSNSYLGTTVRELVDCRPHQVWEAVWSLVADGIVYLDRDDQPAPENWRFKLSATGAEAAAGHAAEPSDPDGYLRHLDRQVPDLDPRAWVYVTESVRGALLPVVLGEAGCGR